MRGWTSSQLASAIDGSSLSGCAVAVAVTAADGSRAQFTRGTVDGVGVLGVETRMYAASLAKQVVGLLAARLVTDGLLDASAPAGEYLPELPAWSSRIRVRHLVHHTSALPDLRPGPTDDNTTLLERLATSSEPDAAPGQQFDYCNLGYVCLAEVVSRCAGRRVELQAADLFASLGMRSAVLGGACPYPLQEPRVPPHTVGDGGLWLTLPDLAVWQDAMNQQCLGREVHALAETCGMLDDGTPVDYAWGLRILQLDRGRTVSHGGSWPTWSAKAVRRPGAGTSVSVLSTSDDAAAVTALALLLLETAS